MKYLLTASLLLFCLFSLSQTDTSKLKKMGVNTDTIVWPVISPGVLYKAPKEPTIIWDMEDTAYKFDTSPLQLPLEQLPLEWSMGDGQSHKVISTEDLLTMTSALTLKILENLIHQVADLERQVKALQRRNKPVHRKPKGMGKHNSITTTTTGTIGFVDAPTITTKKSW